ncbi:hypothetical protein PspLS_07343 [Pyricularia sp. CBS 133598]|nr:hypothetical protein PspLS_07343 [Pyricularia sp. CBS 133598]
MTPWRRQKNFQIWRHLEPRQATETSDVVLQSNVVESPTRGSSKGKNNHYECTKGQEVLETI